MNCIRCGVKTGEKEVFCSQCLAFMEQYPVKPGTPVHIPLRVVMPDAKKPLKKKRDLTPEEQISRLRLLVRRLSAALIAALTVIMLLCGILIASSMQDKPQNPSTRNYSATEDR